MDKEAFHISRCRLELKFEEPKYVKKAKAVNFSCNASLSFSEAEELGIGQPRRCGPCLNCPRCSVRSADMTAREQAKLSLIESNIKLDLETATTTFQYPIIGDISKLSDNRAHVIAIETKVES